MADEIIIKYRADISELKTDYETIKKESKEVEKAVGKPIKLDLDTKEVEKDLNNVSKAIDNTNKSTGGLSGLTDKLKGGFKDLGSSIGGLFNPMTAMAAAGTAIVGVFYKMISVNSEFQQSLAELQSITGVTTKDLEFYRNQAKEIAQDKTLSSSLSETVNAFKLVGSAKPDLLQNKEALAEVTKQAILLSKASGDSLESSVNSLTGTLNQFNFGAEESARVIDVLAAGSKAGAVAIPDLAQGLEKFGAVAKANNVSVEQAVALQETLGDKQIKGAEAGTQLRNIILKLANAGKGYVNGQFDINAALEQTKNEFANIQDPIKRSQELTKLFGLESVTAGQILLDSTDKFKQYTAAVGEQGVALTQAQTNTNTFQGALTRLSNSFGAFLAGGSGILNVFTPIIDVIAEALPYIGNFFAALGSGISTFFSESQYVARIGDLFMALWNTVKEVGVAIIDVFAEIGSSFGGVSNGASIFAKVFDIAMSQVRAALEYVLLGIKTFKDVLVGALQIIKLQVQTFVDFWGAIFRGDFKGAIGVVGDYIKGLSTIFNNTFGKIKNNLIDFVKGMLKIVEPFASMFNIDINKLNKNLDKAKTVFATAAKQTQKEQQKNLATTTSGATTSVTGEAQMVSEKAGKSKKGKTAAQLEKEELDEIIKVREKAIKDLSNLDIVNQKNYIADLEARKEDPQKIAKEKEKLKQLEIKYQDDILQIITDSNNRLAEEAKVRDKNGFLVNKDILDKELSFANKTFNDIIQLQKDADRDSVKNKIDSILGEKSTLVKAFEDRKKQIEDEVTTTKEAENAKKLAIIQAERDIISAKILANDIYKQKLLDAEVSADSELIKNIIASNEDLNKQLAAQDTKYRNEKNAQEIKQEQERAARLKAQFDELFEFANNGLLIQLGFNPQSVSKFKSQVEGFAASIKQINKEGATKEEKEQATKDAILAGSAAASTAAMAAIDMVSASEKAASEERIAQLNAEKEAELAIAGDNEQKKEIIRQKYDQKIKAEKRKQFEADKRASILRVVIATAEAVIRSVVASPTTGGLPFSAIAAAIGAAQIALIASQPTPKFKDGVVGFNGVVGGVGTGTSDSNLAWLSKGESVIPAQATGQNLGLVSSLVNGDVDKYIKSHYILPAIEQKEAEVIQRSQKRIDDIESKIINRTISKTLEAMRKDNKINTNEIVTAIKKDKFTL
jgi:TP901 family phage tail tape measure protein